MTTYHDFRLLMETEHHRHCPRCNFYGIPWMSTELRTFIWPKSGYKELRQVVVLKCPTCGNEALNHTKKSLAKEVAKQKEQQRIADEDRKAQIRGYKIIAAVIAGCVAALFMLFILTGICIAIQRTQL